MQFPDLPEFLRIPQPERNAAWVGRTLTVPRFVPQQRRDDAETEALRAQIREDQKTALLNRLARSKSRKDNKTIDHDTMRWDPRVNKFVVDPYYALVAQRSEPAAHNGLVVGSSPAGGTTDDDMPVIVPCTTTRQLAGIDKPDVLDAVTKANAEQIAKLNSVWKDSYGTLQAGLMTMTVKNRLKQLVKEGRAIIWS